MNVFLMHKERDFDVGADLPWNAKEVEEDLELPRLFAAMAGEDELIFKVAEQALLSSVMNVQTIRYRQEILADCLNNPQVIRELYGLTQEAIERRRTGYFSVFSRYPSGILHGSVELLRAFADMLRQLRAIAENRTASFQSEGLTSLFAMLRRELGEEYLAVILQQLKELRLRAGTLLSARLGEGNKGVGYVLRRPKRTHGWLRRFLEKEPQSFTFRIADRDESGARALSEMRDRGINPVANALAQSADHVVGFFTALRTELAFYVGCLNLHEQLTAKGQPVCMPDPVEAREHVHAFTELYDPSLALTMEGTVAASDVEALGKDLVFITGANQGGKSTFLRSIGLAQLMMQCGMFAPARSFRANICHGLLTHYRREEDETMNSGKFDEELGRMSRIVDNLREHCLILFNESFAATNEREGSEIARQIVTALLEKRVKVFFVTHMYELARGFYEQGADRAVFLCAERQSDGTRTYRMKAGEPLQTSYGRDLYERIFRTEQQVQSRSA